MKKRLFGKKIALWIITLPPKKIKNHREKPDFLPKNL